MLAFICPRCGNLDGYEPIIPSMNNQPVVLYCVRCKIPREQAAVTIKP